MRFAHLVVALTLTLTASVSTTQSNGDSESLDLGDFIKEAELVQLAQNLVQIRSDYVEDGVANHKEIAEYLANTLKTLGAETHIVEPTPNYPTVIGRFRGRRGKPVLGVLAHYNTVAIGDNWTVDPLAGIVKDGRLYGRGAADQKMAMAAAIIATKAIFEAGIKLQGDLVLVFIPGEGAQTLSLPFIVRERPELLRADWYLDTEGGPDIVKIAGGLVWAKITVEGVSGHTGKFRVNPIHKMAQVVSAIVNVDNWMTYERHPLFPQPLYDGKPIVEVGKITGGQKVNQGPDYAEAEVDIRMLPGQSPEGVLTEMRSLFEKLKKVDPQLKATVEPATVQWVPMKSWETLTDNDPLVKAIREVATPVLGRRPGWIGTISGGRPDLWDVGAKVVYFGYKEGDANAHGPDEYASIDSGMKRTLMFARIIARILGDSGDASVQR